MGAGEKGWPSHATLHPPLLPVIATPLLCSLLQSGKSQLRVRFGGHLLGVAHFDAGLFSISGAEAELMDPQQRALLEVSWELVSERLMPGKLLVTLPCICVTGTHPCFVSVDRLPGPPSFQPCLLPLYAGNAIDAGVYVGIQQMEYAGLEVPFLHSIGPFLGVCLA